MARDRDTKKKTARRQSLRKAQTKLPKRRAISPNPKTLHLVDGKGAGLGLYGWISGWNRTYLVSGVFVVLILLFYGNTLANGFVHDDIGQVVQNTYVHSLQYLPKVFTGCIWESALGSCAMYYRPMQSLSYLISYQISSSPWFFHLVNLIYLWIAGVLAFLLVRKITSNFLAALLTGLVFLIHPINSETVNWISVVPELTSTIFLLLATIFYISHRPMFAAVFYFLAMMSKEPAVLLPALFVFYDIWIEKISPKKFFQIAELRRYLPFLGVLFLYLAMRFKVLGGIVQGSDYYGIFTLSERFHAFVTLFGQYIAKLFFPHPLLFYYYPFEKSANFLSWQFLSSLAILLAFLAAFVLVLKKGKPIAGFFLLWIALFLSPVLIFLNAVGENIFSERYLFTPSLGFAFFISLGLVWLLSRNIFKKQWYIVLGVFLVVVWMVVYPRNKIFHDDMMLYAATVKQNPDASSIRRNLAVEFTQAGRFEEALQELQEILRRNSQWRDIDMVYNNLGDVYHKMGDLDQALASYEKFAQVAEPTNFSPSNNIGAVLFEKGQYLRSLTYGCKAIQINPEAREAQLNLNRLVSLFDSVQEHNLRLLYDDIGKGGVFKKSNEARIKGYARTCSEETCSFVFASRFGPGEVIFPFLILGSSSDGNIIKGANPSFDQQTGTITLEVDSRYESETLTFIFPTCDGIYYEAVTDSK